MSYKDDYFEQFRKNYIDSKVAQNYLKSRQLSSNLFEQGQIAFCPIYSRYDFAYLKGRLIVPIRNVHGDLIAMAGRQIPETLNQSIEALYETFNSANKTQEKVNKYTKGKWINEPYIRNRNLYFLDHSKDYVMEKNYIILTEGYFDVLSLYDNGIKNVAALCGTSISDYQIALLSRFCDNIVVLMDSDFPGKTASLKIIDKIKKLGVNAYRILLPEGLDPDDFTKKYDISFLDQAIKTSIEKKSQDITIYGK
jgi:DNA primase